MFFLTAKVRKIPVVVGVGAAVVVCVNTGGIKGKTFHCKLLSYPISRTHSRSDNYLKRTYMICTLTGTKSLCNPWSNVLKITK